VLIPMRNLPSLRPAVLTALIALPLALAVRPDSNPATPSAMNRIPARVLWSWERREDLRQIDTQRYAIAYLDQTITIDLNAHPEARRNPVLLPEHAMLMPVVRIETTPHAVLDVADREATVRAILVSARKPGIAALEIDFDATASQREFYRGVLEDVRRRMPAGLPLSMTALASWCSFDDWLRGLPVDEAVPMMFRMEPDRRRAPPDVDAFAIREPLCAGAVGVSTSEPWPAWMRGRRVYVFADEGWTRQSLAELERRMQ
jgi:Protein of unknown function (DUF3142)